MTGKRSFLPIEPSSSFGFFTSRHDSLRNVFVNAKATRPFFLCRRKHELAVFMLHGQLLETVSQAKYLGITITSDLRWNAHINSISLKANRSLGFLRRNLNVSSIQIKTQAYFTFVRPILENCCIVWDPYTATQINKLEMIQRRAARYVLHRHHYTSSVTNMLQTLGWRSLSDRRNDAKLCMIYKIANGLVGIPANKYLIPRMSVTREQHSLSYLIPHSRCNYHLYSFFASTIRFWNSLPQHVVNKNSLDSFKSNIQIFPVRPLYPQHVEARR